MIVEKKPLVSNAENKTQIKKAIKKVKDAEQTKDSDMRKVLNTIEGRAVISRILGRCGAFRTVVSSGGVELTYYNAGQQDLGHWLQAEMRRAHPTALAKMIIESYSEIETESDDEDDVEEQEEDLIGT